jgi:hypothetical protein
MALESYVNITSFTNALLEYWGKSVRNELVRTNTIDAPAYCSPLRSFSVALTADWATASSKSDRAFIGAPNEREHVICFFG